MNMQRSAYFHTTLLLWFGLLLSGCEAKAVHYQIDHEYGVSDPQFARTMGHLLGPALVGSVGEGADAALRLGLKRYVAIQDGAMSLEEAMREAPRLLAAAAAEVVREFAAKGNE